jgi:hypothetical protein
VPGRPPRGVARIGRRAAGKRVLRPASADALKEATVAYGFQYIPDARTDRRPERRAFQAYSATPIAERARIFRVGPGASAVVAAVESLYRDIEELRRTAADAHDAPEPVRAGAASA